MGFKEGEAPDLQYNLGPSGDQSAVRLRLCTVLKAQLCLDINLQSHTTLQLLGSICAQLASYSRLAVNEHIKSLGLVLPLWPTNKLLNCRTNQKQ